MLVLLLAGCGFGGGSSVAIKDRKVVCPSNAPRPTCSENEAHNIADYEKYLEQCRAEIAYWRKSWGACK